MGPTYMAEINFGMNYRKVERDRVEAAIRHFRNKLGDACVQPASLNYTIGNAYSALVAPMCRIATELPNLIERSCYAYPALTRLSADAGYAGQKLEAAVAHIDRLTIEIIRRSDLTGLIVLPRRWVVERALAWLDRCRRLAKDWEVSNASSEAWMVVSSIRRTTRRIAKLEL